MKDAKVTTTIIPANDKLSLHAIRRAERLAVLEELEIYISPYVSEAASIRSVLSEARAIGASYVLERIRAMKEAAK